MTHAFLNRVATAVPSRDVDAVFAAWARGRARGREGQVLDRMLARSGIEHRYSVLPGGDVPGSMDGGGFYRDGAFPGTAERMRAYVAQAPGLAERAARGLDADLRGVTHLVVASCTGFSAPGVDLMLAGALGLPPGVQRTVVGFMGCHAGIVALRCASEAVRADPGARVLVVCVELCTLHMQETDDLERLLSFSVFADGAAAALVTAEPRGLRLGAFRTALMPDHRDLITWDVGDQGFEMVLSGEVPGVLRARLPAAVEAIVPEGAGGIEAWAVHPGGRSVLDAVEAGLDLPPAALDASRGVLAAHGNVSSASVLFVLAELMARGAEGPGLALAFGPGLTAEAMRFAA